MSRTTALAGDRSDGFNNDIQIQQQKLPKIKNKQLVLEVKRNFWEFSLKFLQLNGSEKFDERYVNLGFIPLNILQDKILSFLDEKSSFVVYQKKSFVNKNQFIFIKCDLCVPNSTNLGKF